MARLENPPFPRGQTGLEIQASSTGSTADLTQYEGKEWWFEDVDPVNKTTRTNQFVKCRVVRNTGTFALRPKRVARFSLAPNANGSFGSQIDGYAAVTAERCYPVDEYLPSGGVGVNDLCWIVTEGPALCLTDLAALGSVIDIGDKVVSQTAATSGATTAGRVVEQVLTGATSPLAVQIMHYIGHAMTARTTNNTDADILVNVGHW
jgi:hypothetical protein